MRDVVVVGAGIVGLATAYRLTERRPSWRVTVVDKESEVGRHQSSHNSGVLHAGVYYPPGSRKAILCREGKAELEAFADAHGVPYIRPGKVVVAVEASELGRLDDLEARARANEVPGLQRLDRRGLAALEPNVAGIAALHSPGTGSIDFGAVCRALADELRLRDVELRLGTEVVDLDARDHEATVGTTDGAITAGRVVVCAGLHADRLARRAGAPASPRVIPFRGSWLVLRPERSDIVHGHVYPVPDPRLPFLGVHLSPRADGEVWVGPNAVLAAGREAYDRRPVARDLLDVARAPAWWRLAARYWRTGARELWRDRSRSAYLREVRRYVPDLTEDDLTEERPTGIRAQALGPGGELVDDFVFDRTGRVLHVRNAPSPAATAALAIGRVVAGEVDGMA